MKHTKDCQRVTDEIRQSQREYLKQFPMYCRACDGWGGHTHYESHGFKGGSCEQMFEPCPECLENFFCPRCLADNPQWENEDKYVCKECGWKEGDLGYPELHWCGCELYDEPENFNW